MNYRLIIFNYYILSCVVAIEYKFNYDSLNVHLDALILECKLTYNLLLPFLLMWVWFDCGWTTSSPSTLYGVGDAVV